MYFCFVLNLLCIFRTCFSQSLVNQVLVNGSSFTPRVVSGYKAELGDVPYQVSFKRPVDHSMRYYMTFCGGVIIGSTKLISAAHCFHSKKAKCCMNSKCCTNLKCCSDSVILRDPEVMQKYAVAGTLLNREVLKIDDSPTGAQWRNLKYVMYPKSYKFPKDDIAVVLSILPFKFNLYIAPISYARNFVDYRGKCLVSGYGRMSLRNKVTSDILLLASIELLPFYWCTQKYRKNMEKFICTLGKMSDVAQGDSGGPLVCSGTGESLEGSKGILVGIVSGHKAGAGSFFTRVSAFSNYIERNVANACRMTYFCYYVIITVYCGFY